MQSIVRIDADKVRVERRMMNLRKRDSVCHDRLAKLFITVFHDVSGIQERGFRQA